MSILKNKIKQYHRKKAKLQFSGGLLNLIVLLSVVWCSTIFLDMAFYFSEATRWFVLIVNGGLSVFLFFRFFLRHIINFYLKSKNENYAVLTKEIGVNLSEIQDKLTNIYQLESLPVPDHSKNLRDYATKKFNEKIKSLNFLQHLKFSDFILPKHVIMPVLLSTIIASISLFEPMSLSLKRLIIPYMDFSVIPEFAFDIHPGNNKIIKGKSEKIVVDYSGPKINGCTFHFKSESESVWQSSKMQYKDDNYVFILDNIRNNLTYKINGIVESNRAWYGKINSREYFIETITPPQISEFQISIKSPSYTKLPVKYLEKNVGDIIAYKGSTCNISATVNKSVQRANLFLSKNKTVPLKIRDKKISGTIKIMIPETYGFKIADNENILNQNPIEYSITVLNDYYPSINILEPDEEIESIPDAIINLQFEGNDDFGFSAIKLHYQVIGAGEEADSNFMSIAIPVKLNNLKYFSNNYLWDLSNLPIGFDESLKYFISISDNDVVSGPKTSNSKYHFIRFPSLQQLFEDFASTEEENLDELEDVVEENEKLQKELEKIKREFKQNKNLDWERKKEIESTLEKQNELQKKIKNIENEIEEAVKKLAEKDLISPEILEKYNQLQELFQDIATPELIQSMQDLQKSIESIDKKKVEQALNKMSFNQKQFKEKLERTLELFKKIQLEQELDRLIQIAKMLLQQQEEISEELEDINKLNENSKSDLVKKESQQSENMEQLTKSNENLLNENQMKKYQESWEKLLEANNYAKERKIQSQMNQMQNQLSTNKMEKAKSSSKSLENDLQKMLDKLLEAQESFNKKSKNEIMVKMQKATNNLLRLSKDEESLMKKTNNLSNLSNDFRDMAQSQKEITDNMQKVIKDIVDISKETFFLSPQASRIIGKTYNNMNKGINALEERNKGGAGKFQKNAMAGLNQAIIEMQTSMQSISQSKSGMGFEQFMKQMQQMAGKQGGLNQEGMDFMQGEGEGKSGQFPFGQQGKGNNGQLSLGQQGELARMAAQQEAIRKSMEQLNSEMGNRPDILGRMDNIADEMKKVVEDMQGMKYSRKTIQRQQRILSRMLDAQKSVREREYSKKRKAEVGKQYARKNPSELQETVNVRKEKLRKELKQALEEGYSIDYEKLIEEYFRNLNSQLETN